MVDVFVYGTLIFPEIILALTGKSFRTKNAILNGFQRHKIFDGVISRRYPSIIKSDNSYVNGVLLFDVDDESLKILDFFEDGSYERIKVKVNCDNKEISAYVYIWNSDVDFKLKGEWDPDEFKLKHLNTFLKEVIPEVLEDYKFKIIN